MTVVVRTLRTALAEAWANRRSFWIQVSAMVLNDVTWIVFWALFFRQVGRINGWGLDQMILLYAILATVSGVSLGLLANARRIGPLVADGGLDAVLTLPVDPLSYLLVRRVDTALLGDLVFGPALFVIAGHPTVERTALYLAGSLVGSVVFVSFVVLLGSLTFLGGGRGAQADLGYQALLILSSYPLDVFGGVTKLVMFTVVPAAFVTGLPVHLVDRFRWPTLAAMVSVAAGTAVLARAAFSMGLRRYRSGSAWTRA